MEQNQFVAYVKKMEEIVIQIILTPDFFHLFFYHNYSVLSQL